MYPSFTRRIVQISSALIFALLSLPTWSQTFFDSMVAKAKSNPSILIKLNDYGSFIQAASGPFSLPGVSSATFHVERGNQLGDAEFSRLVLPVSHSFKKLEVNGMTPYAEMTLSHTGQKQDEWWMEGTPLQMRVRHDIETSALMGGLGVDVSLNENWMVRPVVLLGWARIEDDSTPTSALGKTFRTAVGKELFLWNVDQLQYGAALDAEYRTVTAADIRVLAKTRVTGLNVETLDTSTPGLEEKNQFHSLSANLELDGPTGFSVHARALRWQYFMAATRFDTATGNALKFSWLSEVGIGLSISDSQKDIPLVDALGIRASVILGDNGLSGWTIGLDAKF